jgi:biotin transport system substrate-specific component
MEGVMIVAQTCHWSLGVFKKESFLSIVQLFGASLFLVICSQIQFPLFFSPVPITGQTFAVMLIGAFLGKNKGAMSVLAYITEGSLGLPFFANGLSGFLHLLGPRGGYIWAFVLQAYLVGYLKEKLSTYQNKKMFSILFLSSILQLAAGALWLALFIGLKSAFLLGFLPFLVTGLIKTGFITLFFHAMQTRVSNEKNLHL